MQTTSNLGLKKPDGTDLVDIADLNSNADILDGRFGTSGHTHDGTAGNGPKIGSGSLANGAATDTVIGNRTITDTTAPTGDAGSPTTLLGWLGYMIKSITGKSSWRTVPSKTLEDLNSHIGAGGAVHADVTTTTDGFMTAADKVKLNGIATGANNYVHPNHTGDVTSTGDGVTAIAPGVIVDADVNAVAAIAWTKINKSGSSLADLATRSAADLTSGTLPAARMPALTGDITMTAGTTTATITAGAIVNADVNAAAAIDATKIGAGTVDNTEFGYLNGVTSAVQTQLNGKAPLASPALTGTPTAPTASAGTSTTQIATTAFAQGAANTAETNAKNYADGKFVATDGSTEHIEFRKDVTWAGPAYLDFHTSGNTGNDYDSRIIAEGGTASNSGGRITLDSSLTQILRQLWVNPQTQYGTSSSLVMPIGDSDTGLHWVADGVVDFYSNNIAVAALNGGQFKYKDNDGNWDTLGNLKSSVANGKNSVASAISGKGVAASGSDDFGTLAWKIGQINTGVATASGSSSPVSYLTVSGLSFTPAYIMVEFNTQGGYYSRYYYTSPSDKPSYSQQNPSGTIEGPSTWIRPSISSNGFGLAIDQLYWPEYISSNITWKAWAL